MIADFLRASNTPAEYAADGVRVFGVLSVIAAAIWWTWTDAGILALALPALMVPRFLGVRAWFDVSFGLVVLVAAWSNVFDLYTTVPGWDILIHFVCTGFIAIVLYLLFTRAGIVPELRGERAPRRAALALGGILGLAASAVWEMIEWAGYTFISDEIFVSYADTIGDMAAGGFGGLAGGILLASSRLVRDDS